jgi:GH24 family phage-related lysozyme (muramidase)
MAHDKGSFDYKVVNEKIRDVLDARSELNNTIQIAMPFVKATTTLKLPELGDGNIGFTLGLHAIDQDVKYEDMYAERNSNMPLVGYTYSEDGKTERVYASDPNTDIISGIFDARAGLFKTTDFIRIPPPGITKVTIGRNKNGLLAVGQIEISVPSLIQLETLHRTFLVPGVGMILEWGQQFAPELTPSLGELSDISANLFPWHNRSELLTTLDKLAKNELGLPEILKNYAYASQGQYMWMFGRVANFSTKSNSDGSFNCTVKIVGPSEDSFAYDVQNTVIPTKDPGTKYFCASQTNSVVSYFSSTAPSGLNLKSLLDATEGGNDEWKLHVQKFEGGNKKAGDPTAKDQKPTMNETSFADAEDAYFMTWRFFVNVVLNDEVRGLKAIFKSALMSDAELKKIGLLIPYATGTDRSNTNIGKLQYIDDPMESFVGMNNFLRSADPSTMIIVNEAAAIWAENNPQYNIPASEVKFFETNDQTKKFYNFVAKDPRGLFEKSTSALPPSEQLTDRGLLSSGVWLNHKAVVESMLSGQTILRGIVNLLNRMNQATKNYWNLSLDAAEPEIDSGQPYNYMVIDANFRESSERSVAKFLDSVHIFNKYIRIDNATGKIVGSELIDCSIDLSLPKRLFTQIATLGLVQPNDIQNAANLGKTKDELEAEAATNGNASSTTKPPRISDPNDALRKMFSITSLAGKNGDYNVQGPDVTILPKTEREALLKASGVCGKSNVQTTAGTGGISNQVGPTPINPGGTNANAAVLKKEQEKAKEKLETEICKKCEKCNQAAIPSTRTTFPPNANLNKAAASLLAKEEGLPRGGKAYYDPPSQTTLISIGYGHQIKQNEYSQGYIQAGDERISLVGTRGIDTVLTKAQAQKLLEIDVASYINSARAPLGNAWNKLSINQQVALTSYAYNTGSTRSLVKAGLLNAIDQNDSAGAAQIIRDKGIRTANGQVLQVLVTRRSREAALFAQDPIGQGATVTPNPPTPSPIAPTPAPTPAPKPSLIASTETCNDDFYVEIGTIGLDFTLFRDSQITNGKKRCEECAKASAVLKQTVTVIAEQDKATQAAAAAVRDFPGMNRIFRYIEIIPEYMVAEITDSADGNFANAFGASPASLAISGDITMPGIAGLRVGELFWIDRIPTFYKAFGAFQIMSIEDSIGTEGWTTKVHSTFNYLGTNWKEAMAAKLAAPTSISTAPRGG